jgi:hypothetical protein
MIGNMKVSQCETDSLGAIVSRLTDIGARKRSGR